MFRRVREAARAFYDTYPSSDLNARCGGHGQRRRRRRRSTVRSRRLRVRVATSPRVLTMVSTRALLQSRRRPGSTNALVAAVFFSTFCSVRPTAAVDFLTTGQLIEKHGHSAGYSRYSVPTEDGYLVNLFHIKGHGGPPFLLLHALMGASDQWFLRDEHHDLPSILANNGYDVWLGDFRGNLYSKQHTYLNATDSEYWKFSIDEWALYDVPAMIDFVCNNTEYDKTYLVTYSMSSAVVLATTSARPEYNDKIIVSYHLAPFVAFTNIKSILLRIGVHFGQFYLAIARNIKKFELFPRNHWSINSISLFCSKQSVFLNACVSLLSEFFGFDTTSKNSTMNLDFKLAYSRAGVSLNSIDHLLQMIRTSKFQHYDMGSSKNMWKYGQLKPPEYDLRKVTSPVVLYYSQNDRVVDSGTIHKLISILPNVYQTIIIPHKTFGHIDYSFSTNAKTLVFDSIINIARQFRVPRNYPLYNDYYYYYYK
ncbi:lipase 3-like isoform X2 [Sipha flava]|uniref:Lipase 3-like isoform X2 n=1 Tax=Sipha flava TaxID=143950 RepID=A0A8B8FN88_9HEMI|nr:lipase 3-like isoform X2 [Sipha flava]